MSEWPSIAWTARRSAPPDSRWLANEWPSVWGEIRSPIPAASAQRRIRFHRVCRVIAVPRRERNRALVVRLPRKPCRAPVMYPERPPRAPSPTGTTRSLPPFPSTYRNPAFPSTFSSRRVTTSDARSPEAYISVSIARSLTPSGDRSSGAASSSETWVRVRYFGRGRPIRGALTSETGLAGRIPSRTRDRKKESIVETCAARPAARLGGGGGGGGGGFFSPPPPPGGEGDLHDPRLHRGQVDDRARVLSLQEAARFPRVQHQRLAHVHRERPVGVAEKDEVEPPLPVQLPLQLVVGVREQDRPPLHRLDARPLPEGAAGRLLQPVAVVVVAEHPEQRDRRIIVPLEDGRRADVAEVDDPPHPFRAKEEERAFRGGPVIVGIGENPDLHGVILYAPMEARSARRISSWRSRDVIFPPSRSTM